MAAPAPATLHIPLSDFENGLVKPLILSKYITKKRPLEIFILALTLDKLQLKIAVFYLRFCERWPLRRSKEAFERAKGYLLKGQRPPLGDQNGKK